MHVTIRMRPEIRGLRDKHSYRVIASAPRAGGNRFGLRVIHHSVQSNHIHLIAEAQDTRCLSRGMQGLSIRNEVLPLELFELGRSSDDARSHDARP